MFRKSTRFIVSREKMIHVKLLGWRGSPAVPACVLFFCGQRPRKWVGKGFVEGKKREEESTMTIAELMERMESGQAVEEKDMSELQPTYMVASAAKALRSGQALGADVIIVDPPRRGLESEVLDELCKAVNYDQDYVEDISMLTVSDQMACWANDVRTLIYVSCGFSALASDAERLLTSNGGWMLESATGYVLFPGSDHVETVCIFSRDA